MRNMSEACTAANRLLVHADLADEFATRLGDRLEALTVGDGLRDGVDVGPLIDEQAREKVLDLMRDALDRGAAVVAGGGRPDRPGFFVEPTVLTDVAPDSALNSTEIFGPLGAIQTFTDLDDAIARANDTESGLVGYVITRDLDRALNVSEQLEVGMVGSDSTQGSCGRRRHRSAASSSPASAARGDTSASRSFWRPSRSPSPYAAACQRRWRYRRRAVGAAAESSHDWR
jgi:acyl-CoA reductase-like NAD-dependent aldehyde dehydrogenase